MNAPDADSLPPDTQGDAAATAAGEGTAPAPKRKRAPRKTAAAMAPEASDAAVAAEPAQGPAAEPAAAKPARARRAPRSPAEGQPADAAPAVAPSLAAPEAAAAVLGTGSAGEGAAEPAAERRARPPRQRGPRAAAAQVAAGAGPTTAADAVDGMSETRASAPQGQAPRAAPAGDDGDDAGADDAMDDQATPGGQPVLGEDGKPRRRRNRRRGRRAGEKRGTDGEALLAAPGNPAAADAAPRAAQAPAAPRQPEASAVFADVLAGAFDADAEVPADTGSSPAGADAGHGDGLAATAREQADAAGDGSAATAQPADVAAATDATGGAATDELQAAAPGTGAPPADTGDAADKRVLAADPDAPKLHKVLAQSGVGSRRDLEQMILGGRVTVNGEVAHVGQRVSFGDRIAIDGKPVRVRIAPPPPRVLAYHKPAGEVVTHDDPQQRPTVFRRLPRLQQGKWQSVGRLDINTEGLLLFTNSGELANQLMHPRFGVEREYAVRSLGTLTPEAKARLLDGVEIDGQACNFKSIEDGGGEGVNHWYRCVITEGRNREVRKLFDAVGHAVSRLIRIRYGSVVLPKGLKRGIYVDLGADDLRDLRRLAGHTLRSERVDESAEAPGGRGRNKRGRNKRSDGQPGAQAAGLPPQVQERGPRPERPPRAERPPRPERAERQPRPPRDDVFEGGAIPNPLQQTFDKRAIQQERARRREIPEDGPIPNPLQQTFDKRAIQQERAQRREIPEDGPIPNPLQQTYDKRFVNGGGPGFGKPGQRSGPAQRGNGGLGGGGKPGGRGGKNRGPGAQGGKKGAGPREPDPMQTSVGYIGGDAFLRKGAGGGGKGGPRGPRGPGAPAGGQRGPGGGNRGGRKR